MLRRRPSGPIKAGAVLPVRVQPNARRDELVGFAEETLRVRVTAPPEGGRANRAVVALLSRALGVAATQVNIVRGHGSRQKLVAVDLLTPQEVRQRLDTHLNGS